MIYNLHDVCKCTVITKSGSSIPSRFSWFHDRFIDDPLLVVSDVESRDIKSKDGHSMTIYEFEVFDNGNF